MTTTTTTTTTTNNNTEILVLQDLKRYLTKGTPLDDKSAVAMPVAAIKALLGVVQRSTAETMMGLQSELEDAKRQMLEYNRLEGSRSNISLESGCQLFLKHITRTFLELTDFDACKQQILKRGERFAGLSLTARDRIATVGHSFIRENQTILIHGWSRVVASLLLKAAETKHFDLVLLEGRPDATGTKAAEFYARQGIPTTLILDSCMGYKMPDVDIVLVGAEGVVENGGIVNKLGTYALAICAKQHQKPFYVAAESYKFARLYPLSQTDLPDMGQSTDFSCSSREVTVENPPSDYTPANYITLLFTDLGVLTPSAVSDELIRLYQ